MRATSVPMRLIDGPCDPNSGRHMAERYAEVDPERRRRLPRRGDRPLAADRGSAGRAEALPRVRRRPCRYGCGPRLIRSCDEHDRDAILAIVNSAAEAYRGVIPDDCWHEPYMPTDELDREIEAGVEFWGYEADGELVGVMGIQDVGDVDLIRHAYVAPGEPAQRHRRRAARGAGRARRSGRSWSARGRPPTGRSASTSATASSSSRPSARPSCCGGTGRSPSARSRRRSCSAGLRVLRSPCPR